MKCCLLLWLFCAGLNCALARPAQVILLRHAEKPPEELEDHDLSERGRARAAALAPFLITNRMCAAYGLPVALFAPRFTSHGHARRPYETLGPLAEKLKMSIQTPCRTDDYGDLAEQSCCAIRLTRGRRSLFVGSTMICPNSPGSSARSLPRSRGRVMSMTSCG